MTAAAGQPAIPTILERMTRAGIGEDKARVYLAAGSVHVEGEPVTDPDAPAPDGQRGAKWAINPV